MKFLAPESYKTCNQFTAHAVVLTTVAPTVWPVRRPCTPTSFVPIQSVFIVSFGSSLRVPFAVLSKYVGSWLAKTDEHVAPDMANGNRVKLPSSAAKTGHMMPPSACRSWYTGEYHRRTTCRSVKTMLTTSV